MVYSYTATIPLIYNRFDIIDLEQNMESRLGIKEEITTEFDIIFRCYNIPAWPDGYVFTDKARITLYTKDDEEYETTGNVVGTTVYCKIEGLLCDSKKAIKSYTKDIVDKICKELSLVFTHNNYNRHLFQQRVEPNWNSAKWDDKVYKPYRDVLSGGKSRGVIATKSNLIIETSAYAIVTTYIPSEQIVIDKWLYPKDDDLEFLINEYYSALGSEKIKSKFFHLFAMIEFCESKYKEHNGSYPLYSDQDVQKVIEVLETNGFSEDIRSETNKALRLKTDIGRKEKILNILHWMGIVTFERFGESNVIDVNLIDEFIKIRNKAFHGGKENPKEVEERYRHAVEKLLYINEKIIEFVRDHNTRGVSEPYCLFINGQKDNNGIKELTLQED